MNEKGISLSVLVITIIMLAIITSTTLYVGMDSIGNTRMKKFESELKIIQGKCNELLKAGWSREDFLARGKRIEEIGDSEKITQITKAMQETTGGSNTESYIYYNKEGLENLGVVGVDREIIINLSEKIILDINGVKDNNDKIIYTIEWTGYTTNQNNSRKWNSKFWKHY